MMQQTPNYKLNKPEMGDTFSTAPLNENMDKVEGALDALDARTVHLENCRIVVGQYTATGETTFDLGERPAAVLVSFAINHYGYIALAIGDMVVTGSHYPALKIVDNGFWVSDRFTSANPAGFGYVAFLGDWPVKNLNYPKPT